MSLTIFQSKGNFSSKDYIVLILVKLKKAAPFFKNLPDKLSIPAAFSGLASLSNFKTSSSEVDEKVNFWFSVFRNVLL